MNRIEYIYVERADGLLELHLTAPPSTSAARFKRLCITTPTDANPLPANPMTEDQLKTWLVRLPKGSIIKLETQDLAE